MAATTSNSAYCVKCRATKEIVNPQPVTMRNGRPSLQGTCPTCGTKLVRILPKDRDERIPACFADRRVSGAGNAAAKGRRDAHR